MTNLILGTLLIVTNVPEFNQSFKEAFKDAMITNIADPKIEFYENAIFKPTDEYNVNFGLGPELGFYFTNAVTREVVTNDQAVLEVFTLRLRWGDDPIVRRKTNVLSRSVKRFEKKETWVEALPDPAPAD